MNTNENLFEINTRVWLRRFDKETKKAKINDVPISYWEALAEQGIDYVWLMGIWKNSPQTIEKYCFEEDLVKGYKFALKDWKKEDVIGSPFSIDQYEINPAIGTEKNILELKKLLNSLGVKLILDYIPNHFSAESEVIKRHPEIFLETEWESYLRDSHTFYKPDVVQNRVFAHGRDPFFPAWQDTIQVNYFSKEAREYMVKNLLNLTKICDGVRCDMAMLALNNVFKNTWGGVLSRKGFEKPKEEFWKVAVEIVKNYCPDFIFIAEAYWDGNCSSSDLILRTIKN